MSRKIILLVSVFLLAACTMPTTKIYSLFLPAGKEESPVRTGASINIRLNSPRYLSQPYIAYRTSPYQLEIARYAKWDSPPADIVRDAIRESLSSTGIFNEVRASLSTFSGFYSLELNLKRFERTDIGDDSFGEIVLDAVLLSPEGKEISRSTVSKQVRFGDRSFLGLAKVLSSALSEGITEVRAAILQGIHH